MFVKAILVLEVEIFRPLCLLAQQCHSSSSAFCVKAISGAPLVKAMMVRRRHMIAKARNVFFELGLWQAQLCAGIFLSELCLWQAQFCAGPLSFELGLWQAQFCGFFCLNLVCGRPSQPPLKPPPAPP